MVLFYPESTVKRVRVVTVPYIYIKKSSHATIHEQTIPFILSTNMVNTITATATIATIVKGRPQSFRVYKDGISSLAIATEAMASESETFYIDTYFDESIGEDVVLWQHILDIHKDSSHILNGSDIVSFLKGEDLNQ